MQGEAGGATVSLHRNRSLEQASYQLGAHRTHEQRACPDHTLEDWWGFVKFSPARNTAAVLTEGQIWGLPAFGSIPLNNTVAKS